MVYRVLGTVEFIYHALAYVILSAYLCNVNQSVKNRPLIIISIEWFLFIFRLVGIIIQNHH